MSQHYVTKSAFKAKALEYMRQVEASGEAIVITDHGKPTIEIRRYRSSRPSALEVLQGSVIKYESPTTPVSDDDWISGFK